MRSLRQSPPLCISSSCRTSCSNEIRSLNGLGNNSIASKDIEDVSEIGAGASSIVSVGVSGVKTIDQESSTLVFQPRRKRRDRFAVIPPRPPTIRAEKDAARDT